MRDRHHSEEYFLYASTDAASDIQKLNSDIAEKSPAVPFWSRIHSRLASQYLRWFRMRYSLGHPKADLAPIAREAVQHYVVSENMDDGDGAKDRIADYIGVFEQALDLISLVTIFDLDESLRRDLARTIAETKGRDCIIETFLCHVGLPVEISSKSSYQRQYGALVEVLSAEPNEAATTLDAYLKDWYKNKRKCDWYGQHKKSAVGRASAYAGYWSLESAAVCKLRSIDVSQLVEHTYLPVDLL